LRKQKSYIESLTYPFPVDSASVYVIGCSRGVKIGHSGDVRKRATDLAVSNPEPLFIYWAVRLIRKHACAVDTEIKNRLKKAGKQLRGEWYDISPEEAKLTVEMVISENKYRSHPDRNFSTESNERYVSSLPRKRYTRKKTVGENYADKVKKEALARLFGGHANLALIRKIG